MRTGGNGVANQLKPTPLERLGHLYHPIGSALIDDTIHHTNGVADNLEPLGE